MRSRRHILQHRSLCLFAVQQIKRLHHPTFVCNRLFARHWSIFGQHLNRTHKEVLVVRRRIPLARNVDSLARVGWYDESFWFQLVRRVVGLLWLHRNHSIVNLAVCIDARGEVDQVSTLRRGRFEQLPIYCNRPGRVVAHAHLPILHRIILQNIAEVERGNAAHHIETERSTLQRNGRSCHFGNDWNVNSGQPGHVNNQSIAENTAHIRK
mmetsp:Transcript_8701/g.13827  ORF Transcript_8701/g.13827 Transcript_8701/m.13827 type:complete len:210 (+) Transcript_8701:199-828(+)